MWNIHWWAKCEDQGHALTATRSGLIPLDVEDDSSSSSTSSSSSSSATAPLWHRLAIRQAKKKQLAKHCLYNSLFILVAAILVSLSASLIDRSLYAWSRRGGGAESLRFHSAFLGLACNATIDRHLRELTRHPHVAGLPGDFSTAGYVRSALESYGLAARFVDYSVLLSYPVDRSLSLLRPDGSPRQELSLEESRTVRDGVRGGVRDGDRDGVISPYHAYSPSGDVEAEVVYVNYGRSQDFQLLDRLGVDVRGSIVLARYGQVFRGDVVDNAAKRGAVAAVIFSDPADFASNETEGYFPDSRWLTPSGVQRGTVFRGNGDPLTPGWPSRSGANNVERIPVSRAGLPGIPSLPVSAVDARPILESLGGKVAPQDWQGGFKSIVYRLGRGPAKLRLRYVANQTVATIRNVLAVIKGHEEPDRFVLMGNHRDAWTYGAVDPNSGTAALLEIASRLGRLLSAGWKPRRTIVLCSWDAEEFGSIGSTEWVEENLDLLGARAVAYLNVDCAVSGPGFFAGATPQLDDLLTEVTKKVDDPDTGHGSVYDSWVSRSTGETSSPMIDRLGGTGSDFVAFLQRAGVPAVDMYFGKSYPVYHSLYDNYDWMKKFGDPSMQRHVAVSSIWGLMALRLADCLVLPFNYTSYATQAKAYANTVEASLRAANAPHNVTSSPLLTAVAGFLEQAKQAGDESKKMEQDVALLLPRRTLNDRLMLTERAFLEEAGIPGRTWHKHLIYGPSQKNEYQSGAFPAVLDAIAEASASTDPDKWDTAQHQIWRVSRVLERASLVLRGELT